jgi:hypothetical protein
MDVAPPPYRPSASQPSFSPTLLTLPDHLLLTILSHLSLPTLSLLLRPTSRKLYLFATHLLRRSLYPRWARCLKHGFSTNPLGPSSSLSPSLSLSTSSILPRRRETAILDLYISSLVLVSLRSSESGLHLLVDHEEVETASWMWDLFELLQPRARVEDLLIQYGGEDGFVRREFGGGGGGDEKKDEDRMIWEEDVSVQLSSRKAKVLLPFASESSRGRSIAKIVGEVDRVEGEALEMVAAKLVEVLARAKVDRVGKGVYRRS